MTHNQKKIALVCGIAALLVGTAAASAYMATEMKEEPAKVSAKSEGEKITWNDPQPQPQAQAKPSCDDANVVGAAIGAVAGGLAGNQIGSGSGQDLATIGGAIGGGYLGQQHIPTRNVLCP